MEISSGIFIHLLHLTQPRSQGFLVVPEEGRGDLTQQEQLRKNATMGPLALEIPTHKSVQQFIVISSEKPQKSLYLPKSN
jgi:hypothetical protein